MAMTTLDKIAGRIVKEQELVIGLMAWTEAQKVQGIHVLDQGRGEIELTNGDPKQVVDRLVDQYERLFGRASIEVCREAASSLISSLAPSEIPSSLAAA